MNLRLLRTALIAGVNAVFDVLEHSPANDSPGRRVVARHPAPPDREPSDLDRQLARQELERKGVLRR